MKKRKSKRLRRLWLAVCFFLVLVGGWVFFLRITPFFTGEHLAHNYGREADAAWAAGAGGQAGVEKVGGQAVGQAGAGKAEGQAEGQDAAEETGGRGGRQDAAASEEELLLLVNPWNALPENYQVALIQLDNGQSVDERCYPALQDMMDDCRAAGLSPLICSSYRTQEKQRSLYQAEVDSLIAQGVSKEEAKKQAATCIAVPGTSEHQTGLAVDIVDRGNQNLDKTQEDTPVQRWLIKNCWRYGFILRYPNEKSEVTGIIYEPWHYRYVGRRAAEEIHQMGVCLEEYLDMRSERIYFTGDRKTGHPFFIH